MSSNPIVAGQPASNATQADVIDPLTGKAVRRVGQADWALAEKALAYAHEGRHRVAQRSTGERRAVLTRIAGALLKHESELVDLIVSEAGKPRTAAKVEVQRAVEVFTLAAAELSSFGGEIVPVDLVGSAIGTTAEVRLFPTGVVVGIVPFNFPLNLGAHKVAPALAVGAPIIIKPPNQAPSAQLRLAQLALEAGADPAALQVLPCDNSIAEKLATDRRARVVSFTGSAKVGWHLKQVCPGRVVLELGGNAAALVAPDADLELAAARLAQGAFVYAGQVCIKVQRLMIHEAIADAFEAKLLERIDALPVGAPGDERTIIGPVIDDKSAARIEEWIEEALSAGAKALRRGTREGRMLGPTVLTQVPRHCRAYREEIFGPVVCLERVKSVDEGLERINDTDYGLQAGLFTNNLRLVRRAFAALEVGGVVVNDAPTFRSDNLPYGGVKQSGLGREGVRYAMAELCDTRTLVLRPTP